MYQQTQCPQEDDLWTDGSPDSCIFINQPLIIEVELSRTLAEIMDQVLFLPVTVDTIFLSFAKTKTCDDPILSTFLLV